MRDNSLLRGKHIPPLLSAHVPKHPLDFRLFQIKHYAACAARLGQHNTRSEQSIKYALKFARQGCAIREHARIQVMLVADVRPRDLAYARTTDAFEQCGEENALVQGERA
jgi:hypothetical protein